MSEEIVENGEVYNHYLELSKPTKEDFERVFTEEELKELCLKHKCRIDMWRWNVVNDYRILFTESGRFQRWSERERLGMLAKAVNKMKPSVLYDEEEIIKTRKEEWGLQLKENILSLNFWQHKRMQNPRLVVSESDEANSEMQSRYNVNTESMNIELLTESYGESGQEIEFQNERSIHSIAQVLPQNRRQEITVVNMQIQEEKEEAFLQNQNNTKEVSRQFLETEELSTNGEVTPQRTIQQSEEDTYIVEYISEKYSEDSKETVLNKQIQGEIVAETLHSEEVASEIENIYGVNTMSMTIDSEMLIQSDSLLILESEEVIPLNYENFENIIPLTSTQSQSHPSENMIQSLMELK